MSLASLIVRIGADTGEFDRKLTSSLSRIKKFGQDVQAAGDAMSIGFSLPMLAVGAGALKAAMDIESLEKGLTSITKSSAETAKQMDRLREVAKLPGLGFQEAIQGSIRLQATGLSANLAERSLKAFGNALAVVGKGKADLDGVITALTQIQSKGKVSAEEINQLAERLPQIRVLMKDAFGTSDTKELQERGIGATEAIEGLVGAAEKLGKAGETTKQKLENLGDSVNILGSEIGKTFLGGTGDGIQQLDNLAQSATRLVKSFRELPAPVQMVGKGLLAVAVAGPIVISAFGRIISTATSLYTGLTKLWGVLAPLRAALLTVSGAASAGGLLAFAGAAVTMGKSLWDMADAHDAADEAAVLHGKAINSLEKHLASNKINFSALAKAYGTGKVSQDDYVRALGVLAKKLGDTEGKANGLRLSIAGLKTGTGDIKSSLAGIMEGAGIKHSFADLKAEVNKLKEAKQKLYDLQRQGVNVGGELLIVNHELKEAQDKLTVATGGTVPPTEKVLTATEKLTNAFSALGIVSMKNALGAYVKTRAEFDLITEAHKKGEASTLDVKRATEALGQSFLKLREGLGAVPIKISEVAISFDFARERALMAIGDIQTAAAAARNLNLSNLIVSPSVKGEKELNDAASKAAAKRHIEYTFDMNTKPAISAWNDARRKISQQVSTIRTDFGRGIADIVLDWKNAAQGFERLGKQIASTLIRTVVEGGINQVTKKLADLMTGLGGVAGKIGSLFGGTAGGTGGGVIKSAAGAASSAGSTAASAGGKAAGAGATAMIGAVTGVVSAVSDVIGNFQFMAMNKTLDLIEKEVRYTKIYTGEQSQSILWCSQKTVEYLGYVNASLNGIGIFQSNQLAWLERIGRAVEGWGGGSGNGVVVNVNGGSPDELIRILKAHGIVPRA